MGASLSSVTLTAQHLAVILHGATAFTPRCDMVALHELKIKLFATMWADMVLSLPHRHLYVVRETAQVKVMLIASQDVGYYAQRLLYLTVAH